MVGREEEWETVNDGLDSRKRAPTPLNKPFLACPSASHRHPCSRIIPRYFLLFLLSFDRFSLRHSFLREAILSVEPLRRPTDEDA